MLAEAARSYIPATQHQSIGQAIVAAVAYADIFDYPLRPAELHRYLIGVSANIEQIRAALEHAPEARQYLTRCGEYVLLAGREAIVATRRRRAAVAERFWPRALHYGHLIARLPFVRMVAVTGALAVDNVEEWADIDYLIVTEPGRLWVCRLLTIALVRAAALRGDTVCPNYFLASTALKLEDQSLYAAHELAQMLPLSGMETYRRMRNANAWADTWLPNAINPPRLVAEPSYSRGRTLLEAALRTTPGGWIERWEMRRKLRKFADQGGNPETSFSTEWCKGHFDGHGQRVMNAYAERMRGFGLIGL